MAASIRGPGASVWFIEPEASRISTVGTAAGIVDSAVPDPLLWQLLMSTATAASDGHSCLVMAVDSVPPWSNYLIILTNLRESGVANADAIVTETEEGRWAGVLRSYDSAVRPLSKHASLVETQTRTGGLTQPADDGTHRDR
ncbi:hypothetical protein ACT18_25145 [Mycolicibacter kumamotonensis]|uniref:Uncharacterized protein n=1 Tax=Mycolicibacter kumamotonensis TaxID=354243 RepID=A0A1B8S8K1_9MYCO|nr:hypothetical protein ACT18_25145 [Mycolicibacter kumamotonensis]